MLHVCSEASRADSKYKQKVAAENGFKLRGLKHGQYVFFRKVNSEQSSDGIEKETKWISESRTFQAEGRQNTKALTWGMPSMF